MRQVEQNKDITPPAKADENAVATPPAPPLPHAEQIQRMFGRHDVAGVNAHVHSASDQAFGAVGAQAYATGNRVQLGESEGNESESNELEAHEVAHVVQQRNGRP
ncbi:MAG TPA: DUF4157 domain-containing protein [Kofleriaceae bacterium]|jgi:hypothetical protein